MHLIKKIFILIILLTFPFYAKTNTLIDSTSNKKQDDFSHLHLQVTAGLCECFSLGIGYNFDKNNALQIKKHGLLLGDRATGLAWGLKYTYSFQSKIFIKNISITTSIVNSTSLAKTTNNSDRFVEGGAIEIVTSREKNFSLGVSLQYEFGIVISKILDKEVYVLPSLKIGLNYNF